MGVDTRIALPPQVRLRDVVVVLEQALAGTVNLERHTWGLSTTATHLRTESIPNIPECVSIRGRLPILATGETVDIWLMYHYEFTYDGSHGIMPRSHPLWLAVGEKLVDFFGGRLDYNDCDAIDWDYEQNPTWPQTPSDGPEWDRHQRDMASVEPITADDLERLRKFASYS